MPNFMSGFQGEEPVPSMPFRGPLYGRYGGGFGGQGQRRVNLPIPGYQSNLVRPVGVEPLQEEGSGLLDAYLVPFAQKLAQGFGAASSPEPADVLNVVGGGMDKARQLKGELQQLLRPTSPPPPVPAGGDMPSRARMLLDGFEGTERLTVPPALDLFQRQSGSLRQGPPDSPEAFIGPQPLPPIPVPPVGVPRPSPRVGLTPADMMQARPYSGYIQPSAEDRAIVPHPANNTDPGAMYVTGSHGVTRYGPKSFQGDIYDVQFDPSTPFGFRQMMQENQIEGDIRKAEALGLNQLAHDLRKDTAQMAMGAGSLGIPARVVEAEGLRNMAAMPGGKPAPPWAQAMPSKEAFERLGIASGLLPANPKDMDAFRPSLNPGYMAQQLANNAAFSSPEALAELRNFVRSRIDPIGARRTLENFAANEASGATGRAALKPGSGGSFWEWWAGRQPLMPYMSVQAANDAARRSELVRRFLEGF